jgi:hypothetical protein
MPTRLLLASILAWCSVVLSSTIVEPHAGSLDLFGCHHDHKDGGYHCHGGQLAGRSFTSQEEMLSHLESGRATTQKPQPLPRQTDKDETCIKERRTGQVVCGDLVPR